jgi:hypothetical protein
VFETDARKSSENAVPPSAPWADFGFLLETSLGALLLVCGSVIVYFDARLYSGDFFQGLWILLILTLSGAALILLAFCGRRIGRGHRAVVMFRNMLVGLVAIVILAVTIFVLIGPVH